MTLVSAEIPDGVDVRTFFVVLWTVRCGTAVSRWRCRDLSFSSVLEREGSLGTVLDNVFEERVATLVLGHLAARVGDFLCLCSVLGGGKCLFLLVLRCETGFSRPGPEAGLRDLSIIISFKQRSLSHLALDFRILQCDISLSGI